MDKIFVAIAGFLGIGFTYWFFLGKREKEIAVSDKVEIVVLGGYSPNTISIKKGKTARLTFLRKDSNSCLEEVVIPDFKIKRFLPLNEKVTIEFKPEITGEFKYSCGMGMYHGRIIVRL